MGASSSRSGQRLGPPSGHSRLAASGLGLLLLATCGAAPFAHGCSPRSTASGGGDGTAHGPDAPAQQARSEIDVFVFGRQLGTVAPCGCTTEPLGGLQYAFGFIEATSKADARLVLEPGSFLFPDPEGPEAPVDEAAWAQAEQRATLLHDRFSTLGGALVSGLGPTDLASSHRRGALDKWPMPRTLANVDAAAREQIDGLAEHRLVDVGHGLEAGVTAVIDPALASKAPSFPATTDPVAAAKREVAAMEKAGAALTVVIVHGPRTLAESVAREAAGVDLVVMGGVLDDPDRSRLGSTVQQVGHGYLVEPGDRAQTVTHLTLSLDPKALEGGLPGAENWTFAPPRAQREEELRRTEERLKKFQADPNADPGFIARLQQERDQLAKALEADALPDAPAVAVFEQVKVTCRLDTDGETKKALDGYDAWVATENQKRFAGVKAPAPAKGQPTYVGVEECEMCHDEAAAHWKTTVHAGAYETLVEANKQFDLSCVGCHVTGFRKPGGSEVVENEGLRAIQCEQCHGPGSRHVDDPSTHLLPAPTKVDVCLECHTAEHSDTFDYEAYLRDVLGAGHGADARAKLGDGPTGRELRAAGLEKAGGACKKM